MISTHLPSSVSSLPGEGLEPQKMPGHWLLARLGKRVLRPGGLALSKQMIEALDIGPFDDVVEFAPGLGTTARIVDLRGPRSYTAVERDSNAAALVGRYLVDDDAKCVFGRAEQSGLPSQSADVVFGEAMLTMQTESQKRKIVSEAFRLLRPGGRYAIHEMCLVPDDIGDQDRSEIEADLAGVVHAGVRPLTARQWQAMLELAGFRVDCEARAPMHLLEPRRMLRDEGFAGMMRILFNLCRDAEARRRVVAMRSVFRRHASNLGAIMFVGRKLEEAAK
jgi:SAM-dependent methyltransferase